MLNYLFVYSIIFCLGLSLGSYLNSWMWRVHEKKWFLFGRSICVHCGRALPWFENIPLFSYIFLRGRCRGCKKNIPGEYFWVELGTALIFCFVVFMAMSQNISSIELFRNLFFSALLVVIFVYDAKYQLVLPSVIWLGSLVGLFINLKYLSFDLKSLLIGAAIAGGFFWAQYLVSGGRWIGGGDVRIGVMMGAWLGWQATLVALLIAYVVGAVCGVTLIALQKKQRKSEIAFGTFLAFGTFTAIFWGEKLATYYLRTIAGK